MRPIRTGVAVLGAFAVLLFAVRATAGSPLNADQPPHLATTDSAPADEYFGRAAYSVLVVRHRIFALKNDLHHGSDPASILHGASEVEDAFRDWANRYPNDPWLPRTGWELATLYEELAGDSARTQAVSLLQFVVDHYRWSVYAADSDKDLRRGVGVRPWPSSSAAPVVGFASPRAAGTSAAAASPAVTAPQSAAPPVPHDPASAVGVLLDLRVRARAAPSQTLPNAFAIETQLRKLSGDGSNPQYSRAFWEMASIYEALPGPDARERAIRLLSLLLDRYSATVFGRWSLRDLERGVGERS